MFSLRRLSIVLSVLPALVVMQTATSVDGYFPSRPANAQLQTFTAIPVDYGVGEGSGGFDLKIGESTTYLNVGIPMMINAVRVLSLKPDPSVASYGFCTDWPAAIVLGQTTVTATCWSDTVFQPGKSTWFCDQIDSRAPALQKAARAASKRP